MEEARAEEWRRRGGDDPLITTDAHTPEPGGVDTSNSAGVEAVHMSKKRQRMEQLIQKSMGMVPKVFQHEAVPTGGSQHAKSTRAASIATPGSAASGNAAGDASQRHAATQVRSGGGDDDGDDLHITSHQQRQVIARRKQCWTQEEDTKLCDLVKQHGVSQWAVVAAHFPNRDRKRCRERFVNHLDPQLQQLEWTPQEEKQLMDLQREIGSHWATIARKLPGRSSEDVKNRFLTSVSKQLTESPAAQSQTSSPSSSLQASEKDVPVVATVARAPPKRWSKAEADTLRTLVQAHGATNWFFLASQLPGRTDLQCMQQWYQVLDPAIVKGKGTWTAQEDATLLSKYQELGPKWTQISRFIPGRVGKQCRERYLNHLDPSISKESWTSEEEAKLVQACEKHATQWFQIAKKLPGRSENAIKNRWHAIVRRKILRATKNSANSTCNDNPSDS